MSSSFIIFLLLPLLHLAASSSSLGCGISSVVSGKKCYELREPALTYRDALADCKASALKLCEPGTSAEAKAVAGLFKDRNKSFYIGINDIARKGKLV